MPKLSSISQPAKRGTEIILLQQAGAEIILFPGPLYIFHGRIYSAPAPA